MADPTVDDAGLTESDYAMLESIAPGVAPAVSSNKAEGESWTQTLARLLPTLVLADSQRRLLGVQLDRAQRGLAPLDSSQYGLGVSLGLSPEVSRALTLGVGLLGAVLLVSLLRPSR